MVSLIELSDDDDDIHMLGSMPTSSWREQDAQLALRLQREEEEATMSGTLSKAVALQGMDTTSDASLALRLQREEEQQLESTFKRQRLLREDEVLLCGGDSSRSLGQGRASPSRRIAIVSEPAPVCSNAVALLQRCFCQTKDLGRSEVFLSGPTPIFLQHRRRRGGVTSSLAPASSVVADVATPSDYWTCGYRNVQILIGHLLQRTRGAGSPVFGGTIPNVQSLQAELERLWALGYDPDGRQQLGGAVLGTQKWIGTSEACVLLRGQSVPCNIVSFRGGGGSEPDAISAAAAVVAYTRRHFHGGVSDGAEDLFGRGVLVSSRPPLYLQHDGHSRTVVGLQRRRESAGKCTDFLLVLDPGLGHQGFDDFVACANRGHGWERFIKRSLVPLQKKAEYELLVVDPDARIAPEQMADSFCVQRHL